MHRRGADSSTLILDRARYGLPGLMETSSVKIIVAKGGSAAMVPT